MNFDFDDTPDPRGQWRFKWDRFRDRDVIPMWVADMDFRAPPPVLDILRERIEHGVFGYLDPGPELVETLMAHLAREYDWHTQRDWFVWLPGLVSGLNIVCRAIGSPGDAVVTGVPIYPPFLSAPLNADRRLQRAPLVQANDRWQFDAAALDGAADAGTRLFLLCNPHNPVGRAFTRDELVALAEVCERRDLVICSDEIHCGLLLDDDQRHVPMATLSPAIERRTITLMAASKTFNLPALGTAFAVVPDPALRDRMQAVMKGIVHRPFGLGMWTTLAAYRDGEPWRRALVAYLRGNRDLVAARVARMPGLSMTPVEATYLAWIDCRAAHIGNPKAFFEAAGVGLYDGADFGTPGWVRLNFACSRALLDQALTRMEDALRTRR